MPPVFNETVVRRPTFCFGAGNKRVIVGSFTCFVECFVARRKLVPLSPLHACSPTMAEYLC